MVDNAKGKIFVEGAWERRLGLGKHEGRGLRSGTVAGGKGRYSGLLIELP